MTYRAPGEVAKLREEKELAEDIPQASYIGRTS